MVQGDMVQGDPVQGDPVQEVQTEEGGGSQMTQTPERPAEGAGEEEGPAMRRKRRKKKEPRPESIMVFRTGGEETGGDPGPERSSEEASKFLCTPSSEGGGGGWSPTPDSRYVTLTGTITRGRQRGQLVDIHVSMTQRELRQLARSRERLEAEGQAGGRAPPRCGLGAGQGPHVLLWSLSCAPLVFLLAFVTSFYYGTLTWYNVFLVYNEERSFWHKVTLCPLLVLCYPALILPLALALALYSAAAQVCWAWAAWWRAVRDLEKGFCGWACGKLGLEDCSPYSVVELLDSDTLSGTRTPAARDPDHTSTV